MKKRIVGIIDLVSNNVSARSVYSRLMVDANQASIMAQVVGVWCEEAGCDVEFLCYTGSLPDLRAMAGRVEIVFVASFTRTAQVAYAISNLLQSRGVVTVIGGPHARCYPQDAQKYFDYVLGFTDKALVHDVVRDCSPFRPLGIRLSAARQPLSLPGVRERWKFQSKVLEHRSLINMVHMIGSLGCPYTCSFCIDATVPYQTLPYDIIREDLRFLQTQFKRPLVAWDDPNFGVRFDDYMSCIEDAAPPGSVSFFCHTSLTTLRPDRLPRLRKNGFKGVMPGIESWYDMANKSKAGNKKALSKVQQVAEHVSEILRYIPYVQTNFILGLDTDMGEEPFELTKRFASMVPGAFPYVSLLTAYGQATSVNLNYQRADRVIPFPFHLLNNNDVSNVKPLHFSWPEFFDRTVDLRTALFSSKAMVRRFRAVRAGGEGWVRWANLWRSLSSERRKTERYRELRAALVPGSDMRRYWDGETEVLPEHYRHRIERDLGPLWHYLPHGALDHDPKAYLAEVRSEGRAAAEELTALPPQPLDNAFAPAERSKAK